MRTLLLLATLAGILVVACGGDDGDDGSAGTLGLSATIAPDPPQVGRNTMRIEVHDADGVPVEAAVLEVVPEMPHHGHGSTETPAIVEEGGGLYVAAPVTFQMSGHWEVTVRATAGGEHGERVFVYEVP